MKVEIIPVIDIRSGLVVRAVAGRRDLYRPIETPLSHSAEPVAVVTGLLGVHAFAKLYVADLDAIEATGDNGAVIVTLRGRFPHLDIWTDIGAARADEVRRWIGDDLGTLVLGSESQTDGRLVGDFINDPRIVLSLDFRGDALQGPAELLDPSLWPRRVIAMTLARIGGAEGPDFARLAALRALGPRHELYAAGGVRGREDLARLAMMGVGGALVASALHDGRLTRGALAGG